MLHCCYNDTAWQLPDELEVCLQEQQLLQLKQGTHAHLST